MTMETLDEAYCRTYHLLPRYVPKQEFGITSPKEYGLSLGKKKGKHKK